MSQVTLGQLYEITSGVGLQAEEKVTFTGGTAGDAGTLSTTPYVLFSVTGMVKVTVFALVITDLVSSSGTVKIGTKRTDVAGGGLDTTGSLLASTVATTLDAYEIWNDATPNSTLEASTVYTQNIITRDIILSVGTADITAGQIKVVCMWSPITDGATVTPRHMGISASASPSASVSPSASASPSGSTSPSASKSSSTSPSSSISPSSSLSPSASQSLSPSASASSSFSLSLSPSASISPSSSISPSGSLSPSSSVSLSLSPSASTSPSGSLSPSSSRSPSASISLSLSPSASLSPSGSLSPSSSVSASPSPSP